MERPIIVIATKNRGKSEEIKALLSDRPVRLMDLNDFGPTPTPVEDADNFEDNAYIKASFYARILGFPALADDSGLTVQALDGRPGVHSARYGGEGASDAGKIRELLGEMEGVENRKAAFVCALVLAVPTGPGLTWTAACEGEILTGPQGENGFGYDPVFFHPPSGKTFAQLTREEKSRVSHRGKALAEFVQEFDKVTKWMNLRLEEARPPHSCEYH